MVSFNPQKGSSYLSKCLSALDSSIALACGQIVSQSWAPLVNLAKRQVLNAFEQIKVGTLRIVEEDGSVHEFGGAVDGPHACLDVARHAFWTRVVIGGDLGFAEAFMYGEFQCPDLTAFFMVFIANRARISAEAPTWVSSLISRAYALADLRNRNTAINGINNIAAHYDLSNDMFEQFLSEDMTYSCGIFESEDEPLSVAQTRKLDAVIDQARIKKADHVLEIGTGWGSFSIRAVQQTGCRVTSLTLSEAQKKLAEKRIHAAGLDGQITVLQCNYLNHCPAKPYDKVVAIEMLEHVGREFLPTFFHKVDGFCKKAGGIGVIQFSSMPETTYESYCNQVDFIRKWIFPGANCPSVTEVITALGTGANGSFVIDRIINLASHYTLTLRAWRTRFLEQFGLIKEALQNEMKDRLDDAGTEVFKKKWEVGSQLESGHSNKL